MSIARTRTKGFSLVEVALALGIAGFALIAIFGLLPVGINSNQASIQQTVATNLTTELISDMRQVPRTASITTNTKLSALSPMYAISVPVTATPTTTTIYLDDGGETKPTAATARYKAVVTLVPPAAGTDTATWGSIVISWPAAASTALGSVTTFVGLDRNGA